MAQAQSVAQGETLYATAPEGMRSCSSCHRAHLEGSGSRPNLIAFSRSSRGSWRNFSSIVNDGSYPMPSYRNTLNAREICSIYLFMKDRAGQAASAAECNLPAAPTPAPVAPPPSDSSDPEPPRPVPTGLDRYWELDVTRPWTDEVNSLTRNVRENRYMGEPFNLICRGGTGAEITLLRPRNRRVHEARLSFVFGHSEAPRPGECVSANGSLDPSRLPRVELRIATTGSPQRSSPGMVGYSFSDGGTIVGGRQMSDGQPNYWVLIFEAMNDETLLYVNAHGVGVNGSGSGYFNVEDIDLE